MIIGISGRISSGKDTVGSIIQSRYGGWEVKKFAYKLKLITAILIGCTVEQLEDQNFKNKPLDESWKRYWWTHYKFSDNSNPTGRISGYFMSMDEATMYRLENPHPATEDLLRQSQLYSGTLTPREILQLIGTECGREIIHPNLWVNSLFSEYKNINPGPTRELIYPNWIITDTRFPNEAKAIKDRGGILIRVNRGPLAPATHPSETSLDDYNGFDFIIENNGTIDQLINKVEEIMNVIHEPVAIK